MTLLSCLRSRTPWAAWATAGGNTPPDRRRPPFGLDVAPCHKGRSVRSSPRAVPRCCSGMACGGWDRAIAPLTSGRSLIDLHLETLLGWLDASGNAGYTRARHWHKPGISAEHPDSVTMALLYIIHQDSGVELRHLCMTNRRRWTEPVQGAHSGLVGESDRRCL
jgi:hypothetical protein